MKYPNHCWIAACVLYFAACLACAHAGEAVVAAAAPDWADFVPYPEIRDDQVGEIEDGIGYLLSDRQTRHRPGGTVFFDRQTYRIVERTGLEQGARLDLVFEPVRTTVTINRLQIVRDGVVIDRLPTNPLAVRFSTQWSVPLALMRYEITWPSDQPLAVRSHGPKTAPVIETGPGTTSYRWEVAHSPPIRGESDVPRGNPLYGYVEVSSNRDWKTVIDTMLPHYRIDETFPPAFEAKLAKIAATFGTPAERLLQASRLVQDDIRYVSLSIGSGSHFPRRPGAVIESGFGDCKDKALLLASALNRLGIEAYVALTDIDDGYWLSQVLPSTNAFDHAIVKVVLDGRAIWIDATNFLQGGLADSLVPPEFGYALPLASGAAGLEKIEQQPLLSPTVEVEEEFRFPQEEGQALDLMVKSVHVGSDADRMRKKFAREALSSIAKRYLQYYHDRYPGIVADGLPEVEDDRDANRLIVREHYVLSAERLLADKLIEKFPLRADVGANDLPSPNGLGRRAPIWLGSPFYKSHKVIVRNLAAQFTGPEGADVMTPHLGLKISSRSTPTELEIGWRFMTFGSEVPPQLVPAYLEAAKRAGTNIEWIYNFAYKDGGNSPVPERNPLNPLILFAMVAAFIAMVVGMVTIIVRAYGKAMAEETG